jgi:hypothetical protein
MSDDNGSGQGMAHCLTAERMDKLHQQVGRLDMRVDQVERDLQAEILRSVTIDNDYKENIQALMIAIREKNDIKEFFKENWKYIAVVLIVLTGGDISTFIQALQALKVG